MITVYLDWNIFNKLENISKLDLLEREPYLILNNLIEQIQVIAPYSNAHINDLLRGYLKDASFTPKHLENLSRLTKNLCIVQYWGETKVKWHHREPKEFLHSSKEDSDLTATSFSALMDFEDDPFTSSLWDIQKLLLKHIPVPPTFKAIYSSSPIFNLMFPRTKTEMHYLALCEDIYDFSTKIKSDYSLYKNFRKYLNEWRIKYPAYQKLHQKVQTKIIGNPHYLTWDDLWEQASQNSKPTSNAHFDKIVNLFTTTDIKGYRQDEKFANMIDDALHCFYAAHCNYFITIDGRCYDKAKKVYEKLQIDTIVLKPNELKSHFNIE